MLVAAAALKDWMTWEFVGVCRAGLRSENEDGMMVISMTAVWPSGRGKRKARECSRVGSAISWLVMCFPVILLYCYSAS